MVTKNMNINSILDYAIKTKRFVGGLGKVQKDNSIRKLNGQIHSRITTKTGKDAILIDNLLGNKRKGTKKRWQLVLTDNLRTLAENHWTHVRKAK